MAARGFWRSTWWPIAAPVALGSSCSRSAPWMSPPGWMGLEGVLNTGELAVFEALGRLRARLPFPTLGIDSDNGSEFINHHLVRWCGTEGITLTRSRPYRKNDNCFIEQKNWSVVRRLVGYARFERGCIIPLQAVYDQAETQVNFLQPVLKLREKIRDGAKITKRYDTARTPYRRPLGHRRARHDARHPPPATLRWNSSGPPQTRHREPPKGTHRTGPFEKVPL